jgi:O-antigen biosynthesis protein
MVKDPVISVIIPCFNQGKFIDEAVDSILAQSYTDFEIIIINDGSTDEFTVEKLGNYTRSKTRIINTENGGLSAARNKGFREAKGEFVQYLDADDMITNLKFEDQLRVFSQNQEVDVCISDYMIFDIVRNIYCEHPPSKFPGDLPLEDLLFKWERGWTIPIHSALFKKKLWSNVLPFNEKLRAKEDWFMWCDLAVRGKKFMFLDKQQAVYRQHESNMTRNNNEMYYNLFLAAYYILQIIPENYKEEFLKMTIIHINTSLERNLFPHLTNQIIDLKNKFSETDKSIDYRIGNVILKPYRFFKEKVLGKKYL